MVVLRLVYWVAGFLRYVRTERHMTYVCQHLHCSNRQEHPRLLILIGMLLVLRLVIYFVLRRAGGANCEAEWTVKYMLHDIRHGGVVSVVPGGRGVVLHTRGVACDAYDVSGILLSPHTKAVMTADEAADCC
jgi:hypothetical protein